MAEARRSRVFVRPSTAPYIADIGATSSRAGWVEVPDFNLDEDISRQLERGFPNNPEAQFYDAFLRSVSPDESLHEITFALRSDGSIVSIDPYRPDSVTIHDFVRACEEGYIKGDTSEIYLRVGPIGRGNGYLDWNTIASFAADESGRLLFDAACLAIFAKSKGMVNGVKFRRERAVARVWVEGQGVDSPMTLRRVIDRKPCWEAKTLAQRLRITKKFAKRLLMSVGYAQDYPGAPWCKSDEPTALRHRADWIELERPSRKPKQKHSKRARSRKQGKRRD
jgi:hypothetical protein